MGEGAVAGIGQVPLAGFPGPSAETPVQEVLHPWDCRPARGQKSQSKLHPILSIVHSISLK